MPDFLLKVGSIVLLLGGLIFVHELGHFLVAKSLGVKVVRFSIGFGPRLFGFTRGETEYRISLLPLGGYVKMAGDDPSEDARARGSRARLPRAAALEAARHRRSPDRRRTSSSRQSSTSRSRSRRTASPTPGPVVGTVAPGSPAAEAGLRAGDRILSVPRPARRRAPVRYFGDLRDLVSPHAGEPLTFRVERDGAASPP